MQHEENKYVTIPELAKLLGISRIAVFKKVKKGEIKAIKLGKTYGIPKKNIEVIFGRALAEDEKKEIERAVKKTVSEYGQTLKLLGKN
ncbi:MAG: helix-turn-helix domain-containing protein [Candidatus Omnitrophica bacterium]|nr:helix-turn-helix domain-containing protein [Candidatus Omnitrophota bacterium]